MVTQTLTVEVPASLYERLKARAAQTQRTVETELLEAAATTVPEEPDFLSDIRAQLTVLEDAVLWRAARVRFADEMAHELEELHFKRQREGLTEIEAQRTAALLRHYDRAMLTRAQAAVFLKGRGHDISPLARTGMSKTYVPKALRALVTEQTRHRCGYCLTQERIVGAPMEIDHTIPEVLGGRTEEGNLWLACGYCNDFKGERISGIDPDTDITVDLFNPRHQQWRDHFAWSAGGDYVIGITPTGRATVIVLNLNRPPLVKARQLWVAAGWHPPADSL